MNERVHPIVMTALKQALADANEQRLYRSGKLSGLFSSRSGAAGEAATMAVRQGWLDVVRTDVKGKVRIEWVKITPKGVEFLHANESPVAVLRELGVPITLTVPEPNTWREILQTLDANAETIPLTGKCVAVQEHGVPSPELYAGLSQRGAEVFPVPVYKWAPPEDAEPLRRAIRGLASNEFDVVMFTSSVQVHHLFRFADEMHLRESMLSGFGRMVVASIGPVTSETLREYGIAVDLEPSHPKMGFLVRETAERSARLLQHKTVGRDRAG